MSHEKVTWRQVPLGGLFLGPVQFSVQSERTLWNCGDDVSLLEPL